MTAIGGRSGSIGDDPDEWTSQADGFRAAAEASTAVGTALSSAIDMATWDGPAGEERRDRLAHDAADADLCASVLHAMAGVCRDIAEHASAAADDLDALRVDYAHAPDEERPRIIAASDDRALQHAEMTAPLRHRLGLLAADLDQVISRGDPLDAYFRPVVPDDPQGEQVIDTVQIADYLRTGTLLVG